MPKIITKILSTRFVDMVPITILSIFLFIHFWEKSTLNYLGLLLWIIGFAIWLSGLLAIGKYFHGFSEPKGLVTSGIYSKISHPIYLGGILLFIGVSVYIQHPLAIIITLINIVFQAHRIRIEQKKLKQKYGEKYLKYKAKTWI
jgi:protein-S-isoprenylcysteine O-methyltransferase Ste14